MSRLYLGLGSNLGNREANIRQAIDLIGERVGKVVRTSSFIETEPWGFNSEHRFINAVCLVETELQPLECLHETQRIERQLGRKRKSRKGIYHDRPIDIDLLLYDDVHLESRELTLPHPHIEERDFVRIPLEEIMLAL
ncbi:MAG: 2-amino-4-hydroxy-6-hydroxymethyldihydropteridine diphosphokinase [Bacteroidaceae bacterium]|jgi:2-amino-4-hydroxy-6-hydroxymethyldihydropteridine diphosphokinase|nr:2-amino-4-hydroxy-6-hydroxymethyldihydropteridine diphosphokinase [Bacteroidaceae bacterium]